MRSAVNMDNVRVLRRPTAGQFSSGRRLKADWPAKLRINGTTLSCTVADISSPGANLLVENLPEGVTDIVLLLDALVPIQATVAWRKRQRVGLKFEKEQNWVLDKCRRRFDPAAWMRNSATAPRH